MLCSYPLVFRFALMVVLFWDRRRPRLHQSPLKLSSWNKQGRTPAVPEEHARSLGRYY